MRKALEYASYCNHFAICHKPGEKLLTFHNWKRLLGVAALGLATLFCTSSMMAQTYPADKTPFTCGVPQAQGTAFPFSSMNCRGIFFNNGDLEVFWSGGGGFTIKSLSGGYTATGTLSLTEFTQPSPVSCRGTCPPNTTPGTIQFTWTATDSGNVEHTGSFSATWEDIEPFRWYSPVMLTASLTIDTKAASLYRCGSKRVACLKG